MLKTIQVDEHVYDALVLKYGGEGKFGSQIARLLRLEDKVKAEIKKYDEWIAAVKAEL